MIGALTRPLECTCRTNIGLCRSTPTYWGLLSGGDSQWGRVAPSVRQILIRQHRMILGLRATVPNRAWLHLRVSSRRTSTPVRAIAS